VNVNGLSRYFVAGVIASSMLGLLGAPQKTSGSELPDDSYFQLDVLLQTQAGEGLRFPEMQGGPLIVAMFYASCPHVCPMTVSTIRAIEAQLPPEARERLQVLMITFDPEHDTPAALAELANRHRVNNDRWRFARTAPAEVRPVAAVLGIKYRQLPDGSFNHSSPILLLDGEGREISRSEKLGMPDPLFVQEVETALQGQ
jgi:protein SCO1/2